jgi:hypothetical protein
VFEKWVMKMTTAPKRQEVTGWWRVLHNEKTHDLDLYSWQNITRVINNGK